MSSNFKRSVDDTQVHFSKAMFGAAERSRMTANPSHLTTFNAGDIVPIYCREILPNQDMELDVDFVIRQSTLLTPTMGKMQVDLYAFFVPNRIVNQSWKAVEGENYNGSWTANSVTLAPLALGSSGSVQIPVGSVADYYGLPTQMPIPRSLLNRMHDLKFRGYVMIYNEHFRDQNYQPPIPLSTLNVYQGYLDSGSIVVPVGGSDPAVIEASVPSDGSWPGGAIKNSIYGSGNSRDANPISIPARLGSNNFRARSKPLKANKLHDYFTSVLPSPQKSESSVFAPVSGSVTIPSLNVTATSLPHSVEPNTPMRIYAPNGALSVHNYIVGNASLNNSVPVYPSASTSSEDAGAANGYSGPNNLVTYAVPSAPLEGLGFSVDDIRMSAAIQQVYETLARGGSRYRELVQSFFGITVDDPYLDIPQCLGHVSRELDLYQTAQTSGSVEGGTPQGNLAAFGYTSSSGRLFSNHKFLEHGYLHVLAVVRHRNVYSSYLGRDWFRTSMLDFYTPPLANISEQPVYSYEINPFLSDTTHVFGYQEAWSEYRYEPDQVSGLMRPAVEGSLSLWNYADDFDSGLTIANNDWIKSNSESVLNRSLAVNSSSAPQFKACFTFTVDKELPMPTYSVPGMDII